MRGLPILTVQSILSGSLAITMLLGIAVLRLRPTRRDWFGVGLTTAGVAIVSVAGGPAELVDVPGALRVVLGLGMVVTLLASVALYRRGAMVAQALVAGLSFALTALFMRMLTQPCRAGTGLAEPARALLAGPVRAHRGARRRRQRRRSAHPRRARSLVGQGDRQVPAGGGAGRAQVGGRVRSVAIFGDDAALLAQHSRDRIGEALLWPNATGGYLHPTTFHRHWKKVREAVGRPDLKFHSLRHYAGTRYSQAGATVKETMARLGHSSTQAAMRYHHADGRRDDELAARLARRKTAN